MKKNKIILVSLLLLSIFSLFLVGCNQTRNKMNTFIDVVFGSNQNYKLVETVTNESLNVNATILKDNNKTYIVEKEIYVEIVNENIFYYEQDDNQWIRYINKPDNYYISQTMNVFNSVGSKPTIKDFKSSDNIYTLNSSANSKFHFNSNNSLTVTVNEDDYIVDMVCYIYNVKSTIHAVFTNLSQTTISIPNYIDYVTTDDLGVMFGFLHQESPNYLVTLNFSMIGYNISQNVYIDNNKINTTLETKPVYQEKIGDDTYVYQKIDDQWYKYIDNESDVFVMGQTINLLSANIFVLDNCMFKISDDYKMIFSEMGVSDIKINVSNDKKSYTIIVTMSMSGLTVDVKYIFSSFNEISITLPVATEISKEDFDSYTKIVG